MKYTLLFLCLVVTMIVFSESQPFPGTRRLGRPPTAAMEPEQDISVLKTVCACRGLQEISGMVYLAFGHQQPD
uniref:Hypothetical secreted peptide 1896 n=1 Tax=Amblyomma variegatum TaxID=34610 RepID=F0J9Z8_AMBVA|nr:TPA_inf: hypothetical secreted peptide precursor 1896 [Amblyomma variegatum]